MLKTKHIVEMNQLGIHLTLRWYVRHQILWFLFGSVLSCAASVVCIIVTSFGVDRLGVGDDYGDDGITYAHGDPARPGNRTGEKGVDDGSGVVTANIFISAVAELVWSAYSVQVAYKGTRYNASLN